MSGENLVDTRLSGTAHGDLLNAVALILDAASWLRGTSFMAAEDISALAQPPRDLFGAPRPSAHTMPRSPIDTPAAAPALSPREREVATMMAHGCSNREIADELSISIATVARHASNIFNKLGVNSRTRVAVWAVQQGLTLSRAS
jgi:DNA-binding NarL/FixJ family response regulator